MNPDQAADSNQGVVLATEAVKQDYKKDYKRALALYNEADQQFLHAINYDVKCDKTKACIQRKNKMYQDRAKMQTAYLEKKKNKE